MQPQQQVEYITVWENPTGIYKRKKCIIGINVMYQFTQIFKHLTDEYISSSEHTCFMQEIGSKHLWYPENQDDKKYFGTNSMCFIENFEMKSGPYLDELAKPCNGDWGNPIFWIEKE